MSQLRQNAVIAWRRAKKSPGFSVIAILSLALGIGANTAIFSVVNSILLKGSELRAPEELLEVYLDMEGFEHGPLSYPDLRDLQLETTDAFSGVAGSGYALLQQDSADGVELAPAELVTGNYFDLLGIRLAIGRGLSEQDERERTSAVVLDYLYWQREYGGDQEVVGQTIRIGGSSYTVVGVADQNYAGNLRGLRPAMYGLMVLDGQFNDFDSDRLESRGSHWIFSKARIREDRTADDAERVLAGLSASLLEREAKWQGEMKLFGVPTTDVVLNPAFDRFIVPAAGLLLAVVGVVLLIACANLASFLLARAMDRRKEVAMRLALGASRRELIAQLLTETTLLALVGGAAGLVLSVLVLGWLVRADLPLPLPLTFDFSLDLRVLLFSCFASLAAGLLFGLAPAIQSTNPALAPTLKGDGPPTSTRRFTLRQALVAGQVAFSTLLLVTAGLFVRSMLATQQTDPGFGNEPTGILNFVTSSERYSEEESRRFTEQLSERIAAIPGVQKVGSIDNVPLNLLNQQGLRINVDGLEPPPGHDAHSVDYARIDESYLDAAGVALIEGRSFSQFDTSDTPAVAIVSQALASKMFPKGSAVGARLRESDQDYEIVGVAADTKVRSLGEADRPFIYLPYSQSFSTGVNLLATTQGSARELSMAMLRVAREMDPDLRIFESKTMDRHLGALLFPRRASAVFMGLFAGLALLLAVIGLYGIVSYSVAQRAKEIAIRVSLGADSRGLISLLMRAGLRLVVAGAGLGLILAAAAQRLLSSLLAGVATFDAWSFLLIPAIFLLAACAATLAPAWRASRRNPVAALRAD